jgi:PAS domain S-box-containing protein
LAINASGRTNELTGMSSDADAARLSMSAPALALTSALLYAIGAICGLALRLPDHTVPALWPPNAILLTLLLRVPAGRWWIVLLAAVPAHFLVTALVGYSWWRIAWQLAHHLTSVLAIGLGLKVILSAKSPFGSLRAFLVYLGIAAVAGPALAATISPATWLAPIGQGPQTWLVSFLSYSLAFLALTPAIYVWSLRGLDGMWRGQSRDYLEALLIASAMYVAYMLVFPGGSDRHSPLYLFVIPLLWAAARFGLAGATLSVAVAVLAAGFTKVMPRSLSVADIAGADVIDLQIFLIASSLTTLLMAVIMEERQRSLLALRDSEVRYRAIVETQTELVCRNLPDTTLTFVNEAYCRHFGRTREQLIGRSFLELLPRSAWETVRSRLRGLSRATPTMIHEHEVLLPNGKVGWHQWSNTAIFDRQGRVIEIQGIGRDITALKLIERTLRQSDERFQLVLRATNDLIFDWDIVGGGFWTSADGRWAEPTVRGEPWTFESWGTGIHDQDRDRVLRELNIALSSANHAWEIEYRRQQPDGQVTYVYERGYILRDTDGNPIRMIGSRSDISDRKRLEEANRSLSRIARLATIGEITASIAHELNQPLAAILNNAEAGLLMLPENADDQIRAILEDIKRDDLRASDVIHRLRPLLRNREVRREPVDVDKTVADAVDLARAESRRRHIAIDVRCRSGALIQGDRTQLQQVLLNLLLNGLDAMADTPEPMRAIVVSTHCPDDEHVRVAVIDRGCGIAPEQLQDIFDSFVTTKADGMGLGLAIARSIINAHGGRIWAQNNADGPGATLSFELTCEPAHRQRQWGVLNAG